MPKVAEAVRNWLILQDRGNAVSRDAAGTTSTAHLDRERMSVRPGELPYEQLFAAAAEPVLIVEADTGCIVEANPAAAALLRTTGPQLVGALLTDAFAPSYAQSLAGTLLRARMDGRSSALSVQTRDDGSAVTATASLFRSASQCYVLVRLTAQPSAVRGNDRSNVFDAIEDASIGFLMTDANFRIQYANRAFAEMIELSSLDEVLGKSLPHWLALSAADLARLSEQMLQREAVTVLSTSLRSGQNRSRDVEVSAVAVPDEDYACWGFSIRDRPRLN